MFEAATFKIFKLSDLAGRYLRILRFTDENIELIVAKDVNTGDIFVLEERAIGVSEIGSVR